MIEKKGMFFAGALMVVSLPGWAQSDTSSAASTAGVVSSIRGFAAPTLQAPVGFGAEWGSIGVGVYAQTLPGDSNDADGSAALVFGLGDAEEYAALEVAIVTSSLTGKNSDDSFGEAGTVAFKLHTNLGNYTSFAVGVNGTNPWGNSGFKEANESSVYTVITRFVPVGQFAMVLNLGLGENVYDDIGHQGVGVIASGAFYFTHWLSILAEHTGRFTNAAVSISPFPKYLPVTLTVGAVNLGERYDADTELAGSLGIGYSF